MQPRDGRPLSDRYERRVDAARLLLARMKAGTLADVLVKVMVHDDDSPALDALVDDLAAAPLVSESDIGRLVNGAHRTTIASVLSDTLSPMQRGALHSIAHGAPSYDAVGGELLCSKSSAEQHLTRARARLGAATTGHAVGLSIGMGIIEAPLRHAAEGRFVARSLLRPRTRERDILEALARGKSTQEIADQLECSSETVKDAIDDLREMYGARNRTHLVALAFAVGTLKFISSRHTSQQLAA